MMMVDGSVACLVLVAGAVWVLVRRRRLGGVAWLVAVDAVLLGLLLLAVGVWKLYILGFINAGATVGWDVLDERGFQILRQLELAALVCALALAAAAFLGRWRLALGGVGLLVVHYFAQQWWDDALSGWLREGRWRQGLPFDLTAGGVAVAAVLGAGLLLLIVAVVRGPQVLVKDQEVAGSRE